MVIKQTKERQNKLLSSLKQGEGVLVTWDDAASSDSWAPEFDLCLANCVTLGFFHSVDDKAIRLYGTFSTSASCAYSERIIIPRDNLVIVTRLFKRKTKTERSK